MRQEREAKRRAEETERKKKLEVAKQESTAKSEAKKDKQSKQKKQGKKGGDPRLKAAMDGLVFKQSAKGSWLLTEELSRLMGLDIDVLRKEIPSDVDEEAWITAVVVMVLELFFSDLEDEWELIRKKAIDFLDKTKPGLSRVLLDKARHFLSFHKPLSL
jgi:hypothetical protein